MILLSMNVFDVDVQNPSGQAVNKSVRVLQILDVTQPALSKSSLLNVYW